MTFNARVNKINYLLFMLLFVVVSGFSLYQINSYFFTKQIQALHTVIRNNNVEQQINGYLKEDFRSIESLFSKQMTTRNIKEHEYNFNKINTIIDELTILLRVLEKGGKFTRKTSFNTITEENFVDEIYYKIDKKPIYRIEILVIKTFLVTIKTRIIHFRELLQRRGTVEERELSDLEDMRNDMILFFNNLNPRFVRIEEQINKLILENRIEKDRINAEVSRQKSLFLILKIIISFFILLSTLLLVIIIIKRIIMMNRVIEKSEEKFRTFADFSQDWEYWKGVNGDFIYISPSVLDITGYSPEEFIKNTNLLKEIMHKEDYAAYFSHNKNRFNSSLEEKPTNFRVLTKDGSEIWINHVCKPVYDTNGTLLGVRGSNRDITKEMVLLNEVKEANNKLIKSNKEKNLLMKESHHRIKNNLAITASLLTLQTHHMKNEEDKQILEESSNRINILANLHSFLYKDDLEKVNIKMYFGEIVSSLIESFNIEDKKESIELNIDEISLPSKMATSCGLILNELFTNAFKYRLCKSFESILKIDFHLQSNNHIRMSVFNDVDFSEVIDSDSGELSFGLTMVNILVEGLDGSLELKQDRGAEFIIIFPYDENNV